MNLDLYKNDDAIIIEWATQEQLNYIVKNLKDRIRLLSLSHCPKIDDFTPLEQLKNLEYICIKWNQKATRLWDMTNNSNLVEIVLEEFKKLNQLTDLCTASHVHGLQLNGGLDVKWKVESFEVLSKLKSLKVLRLFEIVLQNYNFEPLYNLIQLERLDISDNICTTEEYAKLAAYLKNTYSETFNGCIYSEYLNEICLVGKGKRALELKTGRERAEKFSADFLEMVQSYWKAIKPELRE